MVPLNLSDPSPQWIVKITVKFFSNELSEEEIPKGIHLRFTLIIQMYSVDSSVMRVGSDTFGEPIFQKGLQN